MVSNLKVDQKELLPANRLVVLVPDFNLDEIAIGRQIWELALSSCKDILFLGTVKTADDELKTLHRMAALSASVQDRRIHVQAHLEFGLSWQKAVSRIWKTGDWIVCCPDHEIQMNLFRHAPLGRLLAQDLNVPVYFLPDCHHREVPSGKGSGLVLERPQKFYEQ